LGNKKKKHTFAATNIETMFKIFIVLFLGFIFLILAFGFSVIRLILRLLFGGWNKKPASQQSSSKQRNKTNYTGTKQNTPKLISKEEGEYIDYEEVK